MQPLTRSRNRSRFPPGPFNLLSQASLRLRFSRGEIDPRVLCGRTTTGTFFDGSGVLQTAAIGVPRLTYNPADLSLSPGLLAEEARTNSIRNSTMQGASAGTPGTLPTNWFSSGQGTLSRTVVGTGVEDGINYVDMRLFGTSSTVETFFLFEATNVIAAASGQTWTTSVYAKVVAGSLSNVTGADLFVIGHNASNLISEAGSAAFLYPTSGSLARNRFTHTRTLSNAGTAFVHSRIDVNFTSGATIDITLRIGLPQLELGASASSPIPTFGTALTRSADNLSMTDLSWYQQSGGVLYLEAMSNAGPTDLDNTVVTISNSAGTAQDFICPAISNVGGVNHINAIIVAGNVSQLTGMNTPNGSYTQNGTFFKAALSFRDGEARFSSNLGNTFAKDNTVTLPTNMGVMHIGAYYVAGNRVLNGVIREIAFISNTNISDSALQQLTRP